MIARATHVLVVTIFVVDDHLRRAIRLDGRQLDEVALFFSALLFDCLDLPTPFKFWKGHKTFIRQVTRLITCSTPLRGIVSGFAPFYRVCSFSPFWPFSPPFTLLPSLGSLWCFWWGGTVSGDVTRASAVVACAIQGIDAGLFVSR